MGTGRRILFMEPAAREVMRLLEGVRDDQLADPTPCTDTPVAALLDHFMGLSQAFIWSARKSTPAGGAEAAQPAAARAENLDPKWRTELPRRLEEMVDAWRDPAAWEGTADVGGLTLPADRAGVVALDELVMHGWDLARATGQPFDCDPGSTAVVLAFTEAMAQPERAAVRQ